MGLSSILLIVAVLTAAAPLAANWLRPPRSIRELEKSFVVGAVTLGIGTLIASQLRSVDLFGYMHLLYLLVVVTLPILLGGWYLAGLLRRRRSRLLRAGGVLAVVIALLGVWGTHIEPNWLDTEIVALTGPVAEPLRIGVLADLQTPNVGQHEWNAVEAILEREPDIVMIPGDFFQGRPDVIQAETPAFIELLQALVNEVEVVAVVSGDSDASTQLATMTEATGALYIDNQIIDLTVAGQAVRLAGVSVFNTPSRLGTIADLSKGTDALTVLLSHRPDVVFELPLGTDVDLIVSGHTHGGQISLPLIGPPVTFSDVPTSVASGGLGIVDNYPLYVSTGVGLERHQAPQIRFGARPSVGIIDVVPANDGA